MIGLVSGGATAGAGYAPTRALLEGQGGVLPEAPGVYTLLKFCATWLSAWSGVPAGVFAPSLAIGAGIGHDVAQLAGLAGEAAIPLIILLLWTLQLKVLLYFSFVSMLKMPLTI